MLSSNRFSGNSDQAGYNALHIAIDSGHLDIVKWLVEDLNFDIEQKVKGKKTFFGFYAEDAYYTPLLIAVDKGHVAIVAYLLNREQVKSNIQLSRTRKISIFNKTTTNQQQTAVLLAVHKNQLEILKLLIAKDHTLIHDEDVNGNSALMLAAKQDQLPMVYWMLQETKADTSIRNKSWRTVYTIASGHTKTWLGLYAYLQSQIFPTTQVLDEKWLTKLSKPFQFFFFNPTRNEVMLYLWRLLADHAAVQLAYLPVTQKIYQKWLKQLTNETYTIQDQKILARVAVQLGLVDLAKLLSRWGIHCESYEQIHFCHPNQIVALQLSVDQSPHAHLVLKLHHCRWFQTDDWQNFVKWFTEQKNLIDCKQLVIKNCQLTDQMIMDLLPILLKLKQLKKLSLAGNQLTQQGFQFLLKGLKYLTELQSLSVKDNLIEYVDDIIFNEKVTKVQKEYTKPLQIDWEGNHIAESILPVLPLLPVSTQQSLFTLLLSLKRQAPALYRNKLAKQHLYHTSKKVLEQAQESQSSFNSIISSQKPTKIKKKRIYYSLLQSNFELTEKRWVVHLLAKKGGLFSEHALLAWEGIQANGQRLLKIAHLTTEKGCLKKGAIKISYLVTYKNQPVITVLDQLLKNMHLTSYEISAEQCLLLQQSVNQEEKLSELPQTNYQRLITRNRKFQKKLKEYQEEQEKIEQEKQTTQQDEKLPITPLIEENPEQPINCLIWAIDKIETYTEQEVNVAKHFFYIPSSLVQSGEKQRLSELEKTNQPKQKEIVEINEGDVCRLF